MWKVAHPEKSTESSACTWVRVEMYKVADACHAVGQSACQDSSAQTLGTQNHLHLNNCFVRDGVEEKANQLAFSFDLFANPFFLFGLFSLVLSLRQRRKTFFDINNLVDTHVHNRWKAVCHADTGPRDTSTIKLFDVENEQFVILSCCEQVLRAIHAR